MPCPFPGMDPYLEDPGVWEEFHHVFITECMYSLSDRLPERYIAKIGEGAELISVHDEAVGQYIPDTNVALERAPDRPSSGGPREQPGTGTMTDEPVTIPSTESIELRQGYIQILRLPDYEWVTSIELLSPWNKYGEGIGEYRHKRRELVSHGVHVVEFDLLRRGARTELARSLPAGDYYVLVFRADRRPDVEVYPWGIRDPLPPVAVPLKARDPDVRFDLARVVGTAYDRGYYARKIRYAAPPPAPPLGAGDAEWADQLLRAAGGRQ